MYKTLESLNANEITSNETAVKHGEFVFCVRRLKGDSFNVTKHNPGSDEILASEHRATFAEVTEIIKRSSNELRDVQAENCTIRIIREADRGTWKFEKRTPGTPSAPYYVYRCALNGEGIETWDDALAHAKTLIAQ